MSSGALPPDDFFRYGSRQPGLRRSAMLAGAVHLALIAVLVISVRIPSRAPEVVTVELWQPPAPKVESAPPKPEPKPEPAPPPPPPPPPKVEKAPPPPPIKKPDIVEQEKPKPKPPPPKPEPKPEPKPPPPKPKPPPPKPKPPPPKPKPPEPPKPDLELEKRAQQEAAQESKQIAAAQEAAAKERALRELLARQQQAATSQALASWTDKIRAIIRSNIIYDLSRVPGNPEAIFDVTLLPTGEVLTVTKRKSSGNPGYDDAVERAIWKSSPLPKPDSRDVFRRELKLTFHPQD